MWCAVLPGCTGSVDATRVDKYPLHRRAVAAYPSPGPLVAPLTGLAASPRCSRPLQPAPIAPTWCGDGRTGRSPTAALAATARDVAAALGRAPDADALWASATLDLASQGYRLASVERAIDRLESAHDLAPDGAGILNDLAIAYLARASLEQSVSSLFLALDRIELGARLAPTSAGLRQTRGIVHARLGLTAAAMLEIVGGQRAAPSRPDAVPGSAEPQAQREWILDTLLPRWAEATVAGEHDRAERLAAQGWSIARRLLEANGDSTTWHLMTGCCARDRSASQRRTAAAASLAYAEGSRQYGASELVAAKAPLRRAVNAARRGQTWTLARQAQLLQAASALAIGEFAQAESMFEAIRSAAERAGETAITARATWGLALTRGRAGRMSQADVLYAEAAVLFQSLGESTNWAQMQAQRADVLGLLGRDADAAYSLYDALHGLRDVPDWRGRYTVLMVAGRHLTDYALHDAAAAMYREARQVAAATARTKDGAESLGRLGQALRRAGATALAAGAIDTARAAFVHVRDSATRERLDAELALAEAEVMRESQPARALERLRHGEAYFARTGSSVLRVPILLESGRLGAELGDTLAARRDLQVAARLVESQASDASGRDQVTLLRARQDLFREQIATELASGRIASVIETALRSRGESWEGEAALHAWLRRAPPDRAWVQFVLLRDRVVAIVYARRGIDVISTPVPRPEVERGVARLMEALRRGSTDVGARQSGRMLYDVLIAPIAVSLGATTRLSLLVDEGLERLPFAALIASDGRALIESHALAYSVGLRGDPGAGALSEASALLIGDPAFDPTQFRELARLRHASAEVRELQDSYPGARVLLQADATKAAVLRELPRYDVVHFAGHARVAASDPRRSHLVLAARAGDFEQHVLSAGEIEDMSLRGVRLVVLSACGPSARAFDGDRRSRSTGLGESFLRAGARGVISSAWEADDDGTARLMRELHRALARGEAPDEALRGAQLLMLRGPAADRDLRVWAAFRLQTK